MRYRRSLLRDYHAFDPATSDAQRALAARGVHVPLIDPAVLEDVHHRAGGRHVTWREWWRSQA
jgi:hypothetical protein